MQKLVSSLTSKQRLTSDTLFYTFSIEGGPLSIKPGQFVSISIKSSDGQSTFTRAYSVADFGSGAKIEGGSVLTDSIKLLIRTVPGGRATPLLENMELGTKVPLMGASGMLVPPQIPNTPLILLSTATGLAPFLSYIRYFSMIKVFPKIYLVWGLRHMQDIHLLDELTSFENLWKSQGSILKIRVCISKATDEELAKSEFKQILRSGRMTSNFESEDGFDLEFAGGIYLCGGKDFVQTTQEIVRQKYPNGDVHVERFY